MKIATWLVSYKFNEDMPPVAGRLLFLTLQAAYFKKGCRQTSMSGLHNKQILHYLHV